MPFEGCDSVAFNGAAFSPWFFTVMQSWDARPRVSRPRVRGEARTPASKELLLTLVGAEYWPCWSCYFPDGQVSLWQQLTIFCSDCCVQAILPLVDADE
jgi:hypothetical protein